MPSKDEKPIGTAEVCVLVETVTGPKHMTLPELAQQWYRLGRIDSRHENKGEEIPFVGQPGMTLGGVRVTEVRSGWKG